MKKVVYVLTFVICLLVGTVSQLLLGALQPVPPVPVEQWISTINAPCYEDSDKHQADRLNYLIQDVPNGGRLELGNCAYTLNSSIQIKNKYGIRISSVAFYCVGTGK